MPPHPWGVPLGESPLADHVGSLAHVAHARDAGLCSAGPGSQASNVLWVNEIKSYRKMVVFMGFDGIYPLVMANIANWKMAIDSFWIFP